jgi:hypothetical protein
MRAWPGARSAARLALSEAAAPAVAAKPLAARAESTAAVVAAKAAAARLRRGSGTIELNLGGHRLPAILREIEGHTLSLRERGDARFGQCRYMDKDVSPAAIGENEAEPFSLIEPLHSSSFPHSRR